MARNVTFARRLTALNKTSAAAENAPIFVAGTAIFGSSDYAATIRDMRTAIADAKA